MNEIKRLQQLAGILSEIRVNKPMDYEKIWDESWEDAIDKIGEWDEDSELENEDEISLFAREIFKERTGREYDDINEDVSDFNIGQSSETGGRRTTVTDVDPETQSVTWSVKKEVDDSTIHKDITDLINKFEKVQLKDFHSRPKLIQLVKDLKSIRNKFSRTVVKEDYKVLKENLVGILNEIKVNQPGIPSKLKSGLIQRFEEEKWFTKPMLMMVTKNINSAETIKDIDEIMKKVYLSDDRVSQIKREILNNG